MQLDLFEFPPRKRCPRCRERKPLDDFSRNRSTRDGRQTYCKPCYNQVIRDKEKKYGSERNFKLLLRYGIDEATYDRLLREQKGGCAICVTRKAKHVDHCHRSKRLRGLLCVNCKNGVGKFEDDVMGRAVGYLESPGPRVESP